MPAIDDIKEGDVFRFVYSAEFRRNAEERHYSGLLRHCFDGLLAAEQSGVGLALIDSYWSCGDWMGSGNRFAPEEITAKGELTRLFNLSEVEHMCEWERGLYADGDWFDCSYQHGICKRYMKRKGAQRSREKMLEAINAKLADAEMDARVAQSRVERLSNVRASIEAGDLTAWV